MSNASARNARYANATVLAVFAYLALVNLDWAPLWDDEATLAYLARNWLELGAPLVDDGRNVFSFREGRDIAADGTFRYPQLPIAIQALVFAVFGTGDIQARAPSAVFSLAAMVLFALVLRHEFPQRPGLRAVALALACLSPITLGYARAGTYNGVLLFFHMLLFWSYLQFCARHHISYAVLAVATALAAFHAHYLSNLVFMTMIGLFHILFRRHLFDRRAWFICASAASVYTAHTLWYYFTEYSLAAYSNPHPDLPFRTFVVHFIDRYVTILNREGILTWSVAVGAIAWCGATWWRARWRQAGVSTRRGKMRKGNARRDTTSRDTGWRALREEQISQYLVLICGGAAVLTLATLSITIGTDVRYLSTFAPFSAIISATMVCWAWRVARPAGLALGAALLLSNISGWPFLQGIEHGDKPAWTLPALVTEYHRDYPDSMREEIAYFRKHVPQNALIYININPGWLLWYLSDKILICCALSRQVGKIDALRTDGRAYLFLQNVFHDIITGGGKITPEYLFIYGTLHTMHDTVFLIADGPIYRRIDDFPGAVLGVGPLVRPEPRWHASRPDRMRHAEAYVMQLYQLEQPKTR